MKCPYCGCTETQVIDSRVVEEFNSIRRRRKCIECDKRFNTLEQIDLRMPLVIKTSGNKVPFDQNKLRKSIEKALHKRENSMDQIETILEKVKQNILQLGIKEISSKDIGETVMQILLLMDKVAYIRFASAYKSFTNITDFEKIIAKIPKDKL